MARPKKAPLTEAEMAEFDKTLGKYAHLPDKQLAKVLASDLDAVADLKQRGCKQNPDGTWHFLDVFAHLCRRCRGRRVRKKPAKF